MRDRKRGSIEGGHRDGQRSDEPRIPSDLDCRISFPPIVARFLKRPGAILHGSFNHLIDDSGKYVELRKMTPGDHITVEMDNWPDTPRVWYIGSEPHLMGEKFLIPDEPYPKEEAA